MEILILFKQSLEFISSTFQIKMKMKKQFIIMLINLIAHVFSNISIQYDQKAILHHASQEGNSEFEKYHIQLGCFNIKDRN